jgi:PadR family transcriptional regulator PadR
MTRPSDLVQGTLDVLILSVVAVEPLHGLAISQRLGARSSGVLHVSRGSLYPALHKLEHQGFLRSEWRASDTGKRAKYYALTKAGARRLRDEVGAWERLSTAITLVLKPA